VRQRPGVSRPASAVASAVRIVTLLLALIAPTAFAQSAVPPPGPDGAPAGGPFTLDSVTGQVSLEQFRGQLVLLNFGYTSCPDICPLTLASTSQVLDALDEDQLSRIVGLFVTLDPERDTAARLADYVDHFHPRLIGLTGSEAEIDGVVASYGVRYYRVELPDSPLGYAVNHSAASYLIDADGELRFLFPHATPPGTIAEAVRYLLESDTTGN